MEHFESIYAKAKKRLEFNYDRKASQSRIQTTYIKLPERDGKPDFEFMEIFIQSLPYKLITE